MLGSQNKISRFRHPISIIYETRLSPPAWLSRRKPKPHWWAEEAVGTQAEMPECSAHLGLVLCFAEAALLSQHLHPKEMVQESCSSGAV